MSTKFDPWGYQDSIDKAIKEGAVYTCPRTGWKFKVSHMTPWSPRAQKAATIIMARAENAEVAQKVGKGEVLSAEDEAVRDRYLLEINVMAAVLAWSGVTDRARKPMKFTTENALMLFGTLKWLWNDVQTFAVNPENYGLSGDAVKSVPDGVDASGNSSGTSDTTSEDGASS